MALTKIGRTPAARANEMNRSMLSTARRIGSRSWPWLANHPPSARKSFWTSTASRRVVDGSTLASGSAVGGGVASRIRSPPGLGGLLGCSSGALGLRHLAGQDVLGAHRPAHQVHGDLQGPRVDNVLEL